MRNSITTRRSVEWPVQKDVSSRASTAIFLIIFILPVFGTILFGAVDNITWVFITVLSTALILLWLAESWNAGGIVLNAEPIQISLILLFAIGLIHLLPVSDANLEELVNVSASRSISLDPYATRFFLSRLAVYIVFFAACLTFVNSENRIRKVAIAVIIFGAGMAFFGVLQRLANPDGIYGLRDTPHAIPFGPFVNQHHFASFMQMTSGLTLGLLFGGRFRMDKKVLLVLCLVLMCTAAILTSSRGGLLGLASVFSIVVLFNFLSGRWSRSQSTKEKIPRLRRNIFAAAAMAGLAFVVVGVVLFVGGDESLMRGLGMNNADPDFSSGRSHYWPIAIRIFLDNPFIGIGFDAFGVAFTRYDTWNGVLRVEQAHNEYLQILAESGIAGFLCVAAFIYLFLKRSLRNIAEGKGMVRDASLGAFAGCFGIMIHSFFDFPLRTPSNAFFFLLLCSIAVFSSSRKRSINGL